MSSSPLSGQLPALYYRCFEQLLPIAGDRVQAVGLDWWDLDRFLGLAFHILLTETDPPVRAQVAGLLPDFGAKAVPTLIVIGRQQKIDAELKELVANILEQLPTTELITGLINILKSSEDDSFDQLIAQRLAAIGPEAIVAVEDLLEDPDWKDLALRVLQHISQSPILASLELSFENSQDLNSTSDSLLQAAAAKAEAHEYVQAIHIYTEAIQMCPNLAQAYGNRGLLRSNLGNNQGAVDDFRRAAHLFQEQGQTANFEIALGYLNSISCQAPHFTSFSSLK